MPTLKQIFFVSCFGIGATFLIAVTLQVRAPKNNTSLPTTEYSGNTAQIEPTKPLLFGTNNEITSFAFSYPSSEIPNNDPSDQDARIIFPERLLRQARPIVHAFIFLPGDNTTNTPIAQAPHILHLSSALREHTDKNIVIMTPHHNGNNQSALNLTEFYATAQRALQAALPGARIVDVAVGGSSAATCGSDATLRQAATSPPSGLRAIIAYDGCAGESFSASTVRPPSGVALYLNPDMSGMGSHPTDRQGNRTRTDGKTRSDLINESWRLQSVDCPPSAQGLATACFGPGPTRTGYTRDGAEIISFQTRVGHGPNVVPMTKIAFRALYRSATR